MVHCLYVFYVKLFFFSDFNLSVASKKSKLVGQSVKLTVRPTYVRDRSGQNLNLCFDFILKASAHKNAIFILTSMT